MKKIILLVIVFCFGITTISVAQNEKEKKIEKEKGFKKENLFTGGSISLAFYNYTFLVGGNPVLGYSLSKWADAGIVFNYNYTSYQYYNDPNFNNKLRQTLYGGGVFAKIYPVKFLFLQGQFEHNFIHDKYIPVVGAKETYTTDANSFLVGGGYTTGREGIGGPPFFYLAILFDVSGDKGSPYLDGYGRILPIIRGGIQVPLFQGKNKFSNERGSGGKRVRNYGML